MVASFQQRLQALNQDFETFDNLRTLQINMGNLCNLHCDHCHVNASCRGTEVMGPETIAQIALFLTRHPGLTLDITGGCPEMNPNFRELIERTDGLAAHRLLRSNLAIMAETGMAWLPEFCRAHQLTIVGSLPCYLEENVDRQRGKGVYQRSIQVLKTLNSLGYGAELELDLVYNPGGGFVPGSQQALEAAYKAELSGRHGIVFNNLFTITNAPIGRFREHLEADGKYSDYLRLLAERFNPDAAGNIMCRTLLSVDWQGKIYNCDFNQALKMPLTAEDGREINIAELDGENMGGKKILLSQHCYCCTAGEGSSCTGALVV
ncbi:MAG: arsenosugar biosynthesis radical SAM protein ArsS [Deltaproteobacteria bacterium]|nr:arsenosugar biosynthesis radical SAM protein ArsS [Deltaproteobacteria bacterium]